MGFPNSNRVQFHVEVDWKALSAHTNDGATAVHYAVIRFGLKSRGMPIPENDIWIAALALQYRLPVLSKDKHFGFIPKIRHVSC